MFRYLLLSLLLMPLAKHSIGAQHDTIYYNDNWKRTGQYDTGYFCIYKGDNKQGYIAECYDLESGMLEMKVHTMDMDSILKDAEATHYYSSGYKMSQAQYKQGNSVGSHKFYYDTSGLLRLERDYDKKVLTNYYKSGKLKRRETPDPDDTTKTTGHCYSEDGKEIKYTPYEVMPKAGYDINHYLGKNLKYPSAAKKNGIEGRAIVKFVVDTDGRIIEVTLVKRVSPEIDAEACRVVAAMKPWTPGIQDDKAVKVYFTLPIYFKLD